MLRETHHAMHPIYSWELQLLDSKFVLAAALSATGELLLPIADVPAFFVAIGESNESVMLCLRLAGHDEHALLSLDDLVGLVRMKRAVDAFAPSSGTPRARASSRAAGTASSTSAVVSSTLGRPFRSKTRGSRNNSQGMPPPALGRSTNGGSLDGRSHSSLNNLVETSRRISRMGKPKRVVHFEKPLEGDICFGTLPPTSKLRRRASSVQPSLPCPSPPVISPPISPPKIRPHDHPTTHPTTLLPYMYHHVYLFLLRFP